MAAKKKTKKSNPGPHKGVILRVKVVRQGTALYAPTGFARAADVYAQMGPYFRDLASEEFWALNCDTKNRVIGSTMVSRGTLDESIAHPREVFAPAIAGNAASVVVVHNHPSGDPEPSDADVALTRRLAECGRLLGILVLDHVIIGEQGYVSLAERGVV